MNLKLAARPRRAALAGLLSLVTAAAAWAAPATSAAAQEGRVKGWGANANYQLGGTLTTSK
ncbi:hypothetical protein [Streptomyces sp. NPDC090029]